MPSVLVVTTGTNSAAPHTRAPLEMPHLPRAAVAFFLLLSFLPSLQVETHKDTLFKKHRLALLIKLKHGTNLGTRSVVIEMKNVIKTNLEGSKPSVKPGKC